MKKRIFGSLLASLMVVSVMGQISSTLSPYSQFGLGVLSDQSLSFNRGMSGLAIGMRNGKFVNVQNPASYSAVDSLTMILDLGLSGQITNFKEGAKKVNARTADFDYAAMTFRVLPKFGATIGIIPFSNIGYDYMMENWIGAADADYYGHLDDNYYTLNYLGTGGFSQAFLGLGWEFAKGFSVGANISYFWGKYNKTASALLSDTYANTLVRNYTTKVNSWKLDLGAQYTTMLNPDNRLTVGAVATIGHKLGADAKLTVVNTNALTQVTSTSRDSVTNAFSIPYSFGVGFSVIHKQSLTFGADYLLQKWGSLDYPMLNEVTARYESVSNVLKDRHKFTLGVDWIPDPSPMPRGFFKRMHYRAGVSYATPYYNIRGQNGPTELTLSAGVSIPVINTWNNRSSLTISAQWVHNSAKDFVTENTFRINIGLTFNERWFAKWKVD